MKRTPVTILTGFLGAGKTTLLRRILTEEHGRRIAVIENEFGAENIDGEIIASAGDERIVQLSNGCICCSIREDLRGALQQLDAALRDGRIAFDQVVIETTGLADPGPIAQTFFLDEQVAAAYRPDGIVTLVDAVFGMRQLDDRSEARHQVGFADRLLVTKDDQVTPAALTMLENRLRQMNPRAAISRARFGEAPVETVLDIGGFNLTADLEIADPPLSCGAHCHEPGHRHDHHHDDVGSVVFRSERPFVPARLQRFLAALIQSHGPQLFRYKGVLNFAGEDHKIILQGVHQLTSIDRGPPWGRDEHRQSRLVLIGVALPAAMLQQSLEHCVG